MNLNLEWLSFAIYDEEGELIGLQPEAPESARLSYEEYKEEEARAYTPDGIKIMM